MKYLRASFLIAIIAVAAIETEIKAQPLYLGGDLSYLDRLEDLGAEYNEEGQQEEALVILARNGFNTVRLRLWHTPTEGYSDLDHVLVMAQRIKAQGLDLFLDFHYSDWWADPGKQNKPAAWAGLDFETLKDSVRVYTHDVIAALKAQGTLPAIVQLGNEIIQGMLWDDGRVGGDFNAAINWQKLAQLIEAATTGLNEALDEGDDIQTMIHIDRGGDAAGTKWFFDNLLAQGVAFDMIGLSYYPWWHGSFAAMQANLAATANAYGKPIIIAETAYPWTLQWYDNTNNFVGQADQLLDGYPATPQGQAEFLEDLTTVVLDLPNNLGRGVVYWEPAWVPANGLGNPWENLALFDQNGSMLPAATAFKPITLPTEGEAEGPRSLDPLVVWPNPVSELAKIAFELDHPQSLSWVLVDVLGREVMSDSLEGEHPMGRHVVEIDLTYVPAGTYLYRLRGSRTYMGSGVVTVR